MKCIRSGEPICLVDDWNGWVTSPQNERVQVRLRKGTMLRLFCQVGDIYEVFLQGQGTLYRIPRRMFEPCEVLKDVKA